MKAHKFSIPSGNKHSHGVVKSSTGAAVPTSYAQQQRAVAHAVSRAIHIKPKRCK